MANDQNCPAFLRLVRAPDEAVQKILSGSFPRWDHIFKWEEFPTIRGALLIVGSPYNKLIVYLSLFWGPLFLEPPSREASGPKCHTDHTRNGM